MISISTDNTGITKTGKRADVLRPLDQKAIAQTTTLIEGLQRVGKVNAIDRLDVAAIKVHVQDEKGKLKAAVVSLPTYLDWAAGINVAEIANMHNKPNRLNAVMEHIELLNTLLGYGVEVHLLNPSFERLEGVYARDIGMVIGDKVIEANFVSPARFPEEGSITGGLKPPKEVKIEGGNVILEGSKVFLGIGDRTNLEALEWLRGILGNQFEVTPINLVPGVLHLDCVFSPIAKPNGTPGGAIAYSAGFKHDSDITMLRKMYGQIFEATKQEYNALGVNTFALDPKTRIVTPACPRLIGLLTELGQRVVPIKLDEIVKGEGYARCSIMPLQRE